MRINIYFQGRFFTKIRVNSGGDSFETYTELDGKLRPPTESPSFRILSFKGILRVNLVSVGPARRELPTMLYAEPIDLNMNTEIPSNMID